MHGTGLELYCRGTWGPSYNYLTDLMPSLTFLNML